MWSTRCFNTVPFTILEEGEIAYHRWQTIRIALLTVAYYRLQYVLGFTKVYPINFVKVYIFNICIVGLALFYRLNVEEKNT